MKTKNKNDKKQNLINAYFGVDKELPGRGDLSEKEKLIKLAKDEADIIFDVENEIIDILTREHLKEAPDMGFLDWLDTKPRSYFLRIPLGMSEGGKVVDFLSYLKSKEKPRIKRINLDAAAPGKAISNLTESELAVVRDLLRRSFGKEE